MELIILGNNSAIPAFGRYPTCQILQVGGKQMMIDCGEGAQMQMQKFGIKSKNLDHIFISHLHGDHYFGLPGFLNSLSLNKRTAPLSLYAPEALLSILQAIAKAANSQFTYPLSFFPLEQSGKHLVSTEEFEVACFPTEHRIPCFGFAVENKAVPLTINQQACEKNKIPQQAYAQIKSGADYHDPYGNIIPNNKLTVTGPKPKKYAYAADTIYTESFLEDIAGADLLYHESTFTQADAEKAKLRFHATTLDAATIAKKAGVGRLLLGHFSSRYRDVQIFQEEARTIFPNTDLSEHGGRYLI